MGDPQPEREAEDQRDDRGDRELERDVPQALQRRGTATLLSAAHCGADDVWEDAPPTTKAVRLTTADLAPLFSALTQSTLRRAQPSTPVEYLGSSVVRIQFAENAAIELYRYPGVGWMARVAGCGELIGNDPNMIDLVLKVART